MQNKYPLWKYIAIVIVTLFSFLYALPNVYGEDPAIQIKSNTSEAQITPALSTQVQEILSKHKQTARSYVIENDSLLLRFADTDTQLKAQDLIKSELGTNYIVAINIAPATPVWLQMIGATPMKYGLDLRGGVHFMLDVDIDGVIKRREEGIIKGISQTLRQQHIRYTGIHRASTGGITLRFKDAAARDEALAIVKREYGNLTIERNNENNQATITATLAPAEISNIQRYTIDQTMSILRNRVNELGVGEAVVQSQGANRVSVDLPGIQDSARAKQILGGTATLEFRMVDETMDPRTAAEGTTPVGSKLYDHDGRPVLLKTQVILSGDSITGASATLDQQTGLPAVSIQLGGGGESLFSKVTRENIGHAMAIVYVEPKVTVQKVNDQIVRTTSKVERVISVATIQSALGNNFQITGLSDAQEAQNLSLLLRAGALPAAIYPIEERTVGPSLGLENINRGMISLEVGMGIILVIMLVYYRLFGLIADIALFVNLLLLVAILSVLGSTLTLPGIASLVLTVGMAVDANVLIYERIREELRRGVTPQAAIHAGYERAFSTIVDANLTTLIVAMVLFSIGTGPIKNFAVVLAIGLITSMLTSITFTRAVVNLIYGGRHVKKLSIGI